MNDDDDDDDLQRKIAISIHYYMRNTKEYIILTACSNEHDTQSTLHWTRRDQCGMSKKYMQ